MQNGRGGMPQSLGAPKRRMPNRIVPGNRLSTHAVSPRAALETGRWLSVGTCLRLECYSCSPVGNRLPRRMALGPPSCCPRKGGSNQNKSQRITRTMSTSTTIPGITMVAPTGSASEAATAISYPFRCVSTVTSYPTVRAAFMTVNGERPEHDSLGGWIDGRMGPAEKGDPDQPARDPSTSGRAAAFPVGPRYSG